MGYKKLNEKIDGLAKKFELKWDLDDKWWESEESESIYLKLLLRTDLYECDTCGCLLFEEAAIRGKSKIVTYYGYTGDFLDEEIKSVYYCKRCAPKKLLKEEDKNGSKED